MSLNHQWQQGISCLLYEFLFTNYKFALLDTYLRLKSLLNGLGNTMEKLERSAEALEKDMQGITLIRIFRVNK